MTRPMVFQNVFVEEISAEATDGCELSSDFSECVFFGKQQMVVKLSSGVTESVFLEEISAEARR